MLLERSTAPTWQWELSPLARETGETYPCVPCTLPEADSGLGDLLLHPGVPLPTAVWCHSSDPAHGPASGSSPPPLLNPGQRGETFLEPIRWDLLSFLPPTHLAMNDKERTQSSTP